MKTALDPHGQPIDRRLNAARLTDRVIDEMIGLARGILADGEVVRQEAEFLMQWLERSRHAAQTWPTDVLYERVREMLHDDLLDVKEREELFAVLHSIAAVEGVPADCVSASAELPLDDPQPPVIHESRLFCFTGRFVHGTRGECQNEAIGRGGQVHGAPGRETDYLVIGSIGSRDWIHSSFGRKIEKAVQLREDGVRLAIVSEGHWVASLRS